MLYYFIVSFFKFFLFDICFLEVAIRAGLTGLGSIILDRVHLDQFENRIDSGSGQFGFGTG